MRRLLLLLTLLVGAPLAACAHREPPLAPPPAEAAAPRTVVLVGIDGFRADYLARGLTPNLSRLAAEGVVAEGGMTPSFPTVTFPNFYTLATGLHPDNHGLVYNTMEDPALPGRTFTLGGPESAQGVWFDGAEPIWVTAQRQGLRTGTMFWPGSDARIRGLRPTYWVPYDQGVPTQARVNMALKWLSLPAEERPAFVTVYFDVVDTVGHRSGPDSPELNAALGEVDAAVGQLVAGLASRGLDADVVVVADHGMAPIAPERTVILDDLLELSTFKLLGGGTVANIAPAAAMTARVEAALLKPHSHMSCWRKGEIPSRLRYGRHPRVTPIVCLAETGWMIVTRARAGSVRGGAHGYDNADPSMRALFIANGPSVQRGVRVSGVESVDVQPLLARLLGVPAPAGDGDATRFERVLTETR